MDRHSDSASSLKACAQNMEKSTFKHFAQLRQVFGAADYVAPYTVFNAAGNKYRLIALVNYTLGAVSVESIMTHADYDKGKWKV